MPYDRSKAVKYASEHWDRECDDGIFWLTSGAVSVEAKRKELRRQRRTDG